MKKLKTPTLEKDLLAPYYRKFDLADHKTKPFVPDARENHISYQDLPYRTLRELVENGEADPEETQNSSPMISEFLEFAKDFEQEFGRHLGFIGYRIRHRDDNRVSVEGFDIRVPDGHKLPVKAILSLTAFGRHADEFEITEDYCRAWWD